MKTKEREPMPTNDFYHDLFVGGYFNPDKFLVERFDIFKVYEAMSIIDLYKKTLQQNNLIEEI